MCRKLSFLVSLLLLVRWGAVVSAADLYVPWPTTYTVSGTEEYDEVQVEGILIVPSGATLIANNRSYISGDGGDDEGGSEYAHMIVDGGTVEVHARFDMGQEHDAYLTITNGGSFTQDTDNEGVKFPDDDDGVHRIYLNDGCMCADRIELIRDRDAIIYVGDGCLRVEHIEGAGSERYDPSNWLNDGCLLALPGYGTLTVTYGPDYPGDTWATVQVSPPEDSDCDGLTDQEELTGWDIPIYNCNDTNCFENPGGQRRCNPELLWYYHVTSDPYDDDTDDDGLNDYEEFLGWIVRYKHYSSFSAFGWREVDVKPDPTLQNSSQPHTGTSDNKTDYEERQAETFPTIGDSDCDGDWPTDDGFEIDFGLNPLDSDTDNDGLMDGYEIDLWIEIAGYDSTKPELVPLEVIEDAVANANNSDVDGDGIADGNDNCPAYANPGQQDSDADGIGDICDNCLDVNNPSQTDSDGDGVGNACDQDCPNLDELNPVNFVDYSILAGDWKVVGVNLPGDLDLSGVVDINDLAKFSLYWLSGCYED